MKYRRVMSTYQNPSQASLAQRKDLDTDGDLGGCVFAKPQPEFPFQNWNTLIGLSHLHYKGWELVNIFTRYQIQGLVWRL